MIYEEYEYEIGHLAEETVIKILEEGRLDPIIIAFLGSRTGFARAINGSKSPRKAAMTILGRENNQASYQIYLDRIVNPPAEELEAKAVPDVIDRMTARFRKVIIRKEDMEPDWPNQFWTSMRSREQAELDNE